MTNTRRKAYEENTACTGFNPEECGCEEVRQSDYRGDISTSVNGHTCMEWTQAQNYPGHGLNFNNNCRNPNEVASRAWCFVENADIMWDYCDVPTCSSTTASTTDPACFDTTTYDKIDADIAGIADSFGDDDVGRSHFLGGIVRLVAHDFMDFDYKVKPHYGQDGCLDWNSPNNKGLETIWCQNCPLTKLYESKYPRLRRSDFWVASANAVICQTSVSNFSFKLQLIINWI